MVNGGVGGGWWILVMVENTIRVQVNPQLNNILYYFFLFKPTCEGLQILWMRGGPITFQSLDNSIDNINKTKVSSVKLHLDLKFW